MEYGLGLEKPQKNGLPFRIHNPCFIGIWYRTKKHEETYNQVLEVLILVIMEYATDKQTSIPPGERTIYPNPCFNGKWSRTPCRLSKFADSARSLNPCFDGIWSRTRLLVKIDIF